MATKRQESQIRGTKKGGKPNTVLATKNERYAKYLQPKKRGKSNKYLRPKKRYERERKVKYLRPKREESQIPVTIKKRGKLNTCDPKRRGKSNTSDEK